MKKILTVLILLPLLFVSLDAKSYAEYMQELKGNAPTKKVSKSSSDFSFFTTTTKKKPNPRYVNSPSSSSLEKKFDKQIKNVKEEVKEVKKEVHTMSKAIESSNKDLIKEVKDVKKEVQKSNSYKHGKGVIPVAMINEPAPSILKNSFLYVGFGFQGLTVEDDNGYFGENALDDSALDIKAGYGHYFNVGETKLFATGGFEYFALKQADMKAVIASINTEAKLNENVMGYIGLKTGLSYLVWDIQQDEAVESITSTSPLIGIQVGIEYQFSGGFSLVLGGEYTKYFHETQIPNDILNTSSGYGVNISLKFYQ